MSRRSRMKIGTFAPRVFRVHARRWKPGTLAVNGSYLRNQILPWFGGLAVAEVGRRDVERWLASLSATPGAANRAIPVLSLIFREAARLGLRPAGPNPCHRLRHYPSRPRERFLTAVELGRLGCALAEAPPVFAALVRLLALTGCRSGEARTLLWADYREGRLYLRDGKTGPRTVWLSSPARGVLDRLPRESRWVFPRPGVAGRGHLTANDVRAVWLPVAAAAGLEGVRLHDLRHTFASRGLEIGETVLTVGRLLGHGDPATTLRYAHCADAAAASAAEDLGGVLGG